MGFEDLFQILVALAVLFGLFGRKKKRPGGGEAEQRWTQRTRAQPPVSRTQPPPQRPLEVRRPLPGLLGPRGHAPPVESEMSGAPTMADELYRMLSGDMERRREETIEAEGTSLEVDRIEAIERMPVEEIRPLEQITDVEAYSLETLEPAGEASHRAFHRKYDSPPSAASPAAPATPQRRRLTLDVRSARQAMLWTEILGPPKGMP